MLRLCAFTLLHQPPLIAVPRPVSSDQALVLSRYTFCTHASIELHKSLLPFSAFFQPLSFAVVAGDFLGSVGFLGFQKKHLHRQLVRGHALRQQLLVIGSVRSKVGAVAKDPGLDAVKIHITWEFASLECFQKLWDTDCC